MSVKRACALVLATLGLAGVGGCAPEPAPDWMLGVFSSDLPGSAQALAIERHYIYENGEMEYISGPTAEPKRRSWRRDRAESILIYPDPTEPGFPREIYSWRILPTDVCDVLEIREIFKGEEHEDGSELYRGEVCVREIDSDLHGGEYEHYWCEEPPEPCDDQ